MHYALAILLLLAGLLFIQPAGAQTIITETNGNHAAINLGNLSAADLDGDGLISQAEYFNYYNRRFTTLDRNHDGVLSLGERTTIIKTRNPTHIIQRDRHDVHLPEQDCDPINGRACPN